MSSSSPPSSTTLSPLSDSDSDSKSQSMSDPPNSESLAMSSEHHQYIRIQNWCRCGSSYRRRVRCRLPSPWSLRQYKLDELVGRVWHEQLLLCDSCEVFS